MCVGLGLGVGINKRTDGERRKGRTRSLVALRPRKRRRRDITRGSGWMLGSGMVDASVGALVLVRWCWCEERACVFWSTHACGSGQWCGESAGRVNGLGLNVVR